MKYNVGDLVYATKSQTIGIIVEIVDHKTKTNFFGRPGYMIFWQDEDRSLFYDTYSVEHFHKSAQILSKRMAKEDCE
jgi:hypothetical protein